MAARVGTWSDYHLGNDEGMSFLDKVKAKAEELLGRAEQVYGESHGDAAAEVAGEAHVLEAEAEEEELERDEHRGDDSPFAR
jgi:uncharacterized protein YjbJ (UPF0337 family)